MKPVEPQITLVASSVPTGALSPSSTPISTGWSISWRNPHFNQIEATCDQLKMTKMMSFKYDWNKEVICQFYSTLYFIADGQKIIWLINNRQYEITVRQFAHFLGLEHQLTMDSESRIHTYEILKKE
jgi:hypothetical protein